MTATQMLTAGLNAALRRPIVNGSVLRKGLIERGVIKPQTKWELQKWQTTAPGGYLVRKVLVEVNHAG